MPLKKYSVNATNKQKRKETDFLHLQNNKCWTSIKTNDGSKVHSMPTLLSRSNKFFSSDNNSKLCAEGAQKKLLYMLKINAQYIKVFWKLVTSPLSTISNFLQEDIPKAVCNSHQQMNLIQKCLWSLKTKFRFISTQKLKLTGLISVRNTLHVLWQYQFPTIISIHSKCAVYDHIVVVWQGQVLDYESEIIYMLTEDLLHQMCGGNTTFSHISCGYGLFPPTSIQAMSPEVIDWGDSSHYGKNLPIRKFFTRK